MNIQQQVIQNATNITNLAGEVKEMKTACKEKHNTEYKVKIDWRNTFLVLIGISLNVLLFFQKVK